MASKRSRKSKSSAESSDWRTLYALADALRSRGEAGRALELMRDEMRRAPAWAPPYNYAGWMLVMAGPDTVDEGIDLLKRAASLDGDYGDAYFNEGLGWTIKRDFDAAIRAFRHALGAKVLTDRPATFWNLSRLYEQRGWRSRARWAAANALADETGDRRETFAAAVSRLDEELASRGLPPEPDTDPDVAIVDDIRALERKGRVQDALDLVPRAGLDAEQALLLTADLAERAADALPRGADADALYEVAERALRAYASWSTSGAEGLGRMADVTRVVDKRRGRR